jgi:hypothetical protein
MGSEQRPRFFPSLGTLARPGRVSVRLLRTAHHHWRKIFKKSQSPNLIIGKANGELPELRIVRSRLAGIRNANLLNSNLHRP